MKRAMKPIHPGTIFREDILKALDLTVNDAAKALDVSRKQVSEIVNERAAVSAEMAVHIYQVFGVQADFWLDLQNKFEIWQIEQSGKIHLRRFKGQSKTTA